jgi:ABC-2 type transport system ATP-binding protein
MEEAEHLADGIVVIDTGSVVARGTADELKDHLGGNVLEIRVSNADELGRVATLVAGLGSKPPRIDRDLNQVRLPVREGPRSLIAAGRVLDDSGIELEDLGIRRPSLDDVFLSLTGHPTGTDAGPVADTRAHGGQR